MIWIINEINIKKQKKFSNKGGTQCLGIIKKYHTSENLKNFKTSIRIETQYKSIIILSKQ